MNAQQRAEKIVIEARKMNVELGGPVLFPMIAAEIESAVEEERERCAKIVEDGHRSYRCKDPEDCPYCCFATAIRSRSKGVPVEHDGNTPHCGCDCRGCLGFIPGTKMFEINEKMLDEKGLGNEN